MTSSKTKLPTKRRVLTALLRSLDDKKHRQTAPGSTTQNPLRDLSPRARHLFLTLHVLYPNELLPALDLLDRSLVSRFHRQISTADENDDSSTMATTAVRTENDQVHPSVVGRPKTAATRYGVYYVRSSQSSSTYSRSAGNAKYARDVDPVASSTHYEVRTEAWSCSCPAFTFAAFPASVPLGKERRLDRTSAGDDGGTDQISMLDHDRYESDALNDGNEHDDLGGLLCSASEMPMCKHLLACVLTEQCTSLFGHFVQEKELSAEEMCAWAAGWGG